MVTPNGVRSYVVQYRIGGRSGRSRRVTIGGHGNPWTADKARERAGDLLEVARKGIDPVEAERERSREQEAAKRAAERLAFSDYADLFIRRYARARKLRSADDIAAVFERDLKPHFLGKSLPSLQRTDIQAALDTISERSGSAANKAHTHLRKMLSWAVERGDLEASQMESMAPPAKPGEIGRESWRERGRQYV